MKAFKVHTPFRYPTTKYYVVQRLSRFSVYKDTALHWFFAQSRMTEYFDIVMTDEKCHHKNCECAFTVRGIHPTTSGYEHSSIQGTLEEKILDSGSHVAASFKIRDGVPEPADGDLESERIKLSLSKKNSIMPTQIDKDFRGGWPESRELGMPDRRVLKALMVSDFRHLRRKFGRHLISWDRLAQKVWAPPRREWVRKEKKFIPVEIYGSSPQPLVRKELREQECWVESSPTDPGAELNDPIPSLQDMILKKESGYWNTMGSHQGRPFVVSAMSNLFPLKYSDSILNMNRPTHEVPKAFEEIKKYVPKAMDILYHKMGIYEFGKDKSSISLDDLEGMYLGASNGINFGKNFVITDPGFDQPIYISPKGKKIDTFQSDLEAILDFLRTGEAPPVYWNITPKNENFFSWAKQMSDQDWESWKKKVRLFVIPSSIFILGEKMVSNFRHHKERGWVISVGYSHSQGGPDKLAKMLGVDLKNCFKKIIEEGDAKNFDQSVLEFFVNLYYSTMQIHEDPNSADFDLKRQITKWLLSNMITRLTRIFSSEWAWIRGQVPSGCYNTSHMDSWIMAMYFFLFGVVTIEQAPYEHREELEEALLNCVRLIVYGDDHLYNRGEGLSAQYFCADRFADFCKKYLGVVIRDIFSGATFCSDVYGGWLTRRGATYLKHQFVVNENKTPGQSTFLAFRESREFLIRAIWGRETKTVRSPLDVLLSTVGHAYGTYASNRDAYDRLRFLYEELVIALKLTPGELMANILENLDKEDMGKLRQLSLSTDELLRGFPTWETLEKKNIMNWAYHDVAHEYVEFESLFG